MKNTDNTETKHNHEKACNAKHSKTKLPWCKRVMLHSPLHFVAHAHTVVWQCCKDDRESQSEMAKFYPQPTLNPWTDRHQIWNTWLCRGCLPPRKIRG